MRRLLARPALVVFECAIALGLVRTATFCSALGMWSMGLKPPCWWPDGGA